MLVEDKQTSVEYTENIETVKEDWLKTMTLIIIKEIKVDVNNQP